MYGGPGGDADAQRQPGIASQIGVLEPGPDAHPELVDLDPVRRGVVPAQNHAGEVHQLFVIESVGGLLDLGGGVFPDVDRRLPLLVDALGRQGAVAGGIGMLAVMVARKIQIGNALRMAEQIPVGQKILVVGKPVVQHFRRHQLSGIELVPKPVIHVVVMEQRVQMGGRLQNGGLAGGGSFRRNAAGEAVVPAAGDLLPGGPGGLIQRLQKSGMIEVIRIAESEPPGAQILPGPHPGRPGRRDAALALAQHHKPGVPGFVAVPQRRRPVGGAVVHQDTGKIPERLRRDGVQAIRQKPFPVVNRNNHGNAGIGELGACLAHTVSSPL